MSGPAIRAVFDCNVLVQAALDENGPAFACLLLAESRRIELVTCAELLNELQNVLCRPKLRRRYRRLTQERVDTFLNSIAHMATIFTKVNKVFTYERDPKDEMYVDIAVTVAATHLVSRDRDLLDLMTGQTPVAQDFRQRCPQLAIVDPVMFLQIAKHSLTR